MIRVESHGVVRYEFAILAFHPEVRHGVFARRGGVSRDHLSALNVSLAVGDRQEAVVENRRRLMSALEMDLSHTVTAGQVHGATVEVVDAARLHDDDSRHVSATDGLLVAEPGLGLLMTFADCVPIVLYDPRHRVLGLVHAGWRGTVQGIGPQAVSAMCRHFGTRTDEILAGIGPSIGPCCYEVGEDVTAATRLTLPDADTTVLHQIGGRIHFDLWEANRRLLMMAGVPSGHIENSAICTACNVEEFYSHRREGGRTGRFGAAVALQVGHRR